MKSITFELPTGEATFTLWAHADGREVLALRDATGDYPTEASHGWTSDYTSLPADADEAADLLARLDWSADFDALRREGFASAGYQLIYTVTTYTDKYGLAPDAVQVPWEEVVALLGHDHRGTPHDDNLLIAALLAAGAPEWVRDAEGYLDESGWCLIEPLQHDDYYMHAVSGHVQRQDDWIAEMTPDTEEDEETGYTQEELFDLAVERDNLIAVQWDAGTRRWVAWQSKAVAR